VITSDIPTGKGGVEKANYFIIIVHLLSSFIIGYHPRFCGFDSRRPLEIFFWEGSKRLMAVFLAVLFWSIPEYTVTDSNQNRTIHLQKGSLGCTLIFL